MTLGDRIVVMRYGVLQQLDTPQRLFDKPSNRFVAGFISTPPMNFSNVTELMGNEVFLYLIVGGKIFAARVNPRTSARAGMQIDCVADMQNLHIFELQTEEAIVRVPQDGFLSVAGKNWRRRAGEGMRSRVLPSC